MFNTFTISNVGATRMVRLSSFTLDPSLEFHHNLVPHKFEKMCQERLNSNFGKLEPYFGKNLGSKL